MSQFLRIAALPCLLLLGLGGASCSITGDGAWSGFHVNAGAGGFQSGLDGSVTTDFTVAGSPGSSTVNLTENAGLGKSQFNPYVDARIGVVPFEIGLTGFDYSDSGAGTLNGRYLGTTFSGSVQSDFELRSLRGTVGIDVIALDMLRVGLLGGVNYMDLNFALSGIDASSGLRVNETIDEGLPIPVLGARADVGIIEDLRVGAQVLGLNLDVEDFDIDFLDFEAMLHYEPVPWVEAFVGYRAINFDWAGMSGGEQVRADLEMSGPVFGVGISF